MMSASGGSKKRQRAKASRRLKESSSSAQQQQQQHEEEEYYNVNDLRGIQKKRPKLNHFVQGMVHREPALRGQQQNARERSKVVVVKSSQQKKKRISSISRTRGGRGRATHSHSQHAYSSSEHVDEFYGSGAQQQSLRRYNAASSSSMFVVGETPIRNSGVVEETPIRSRPGSHRKVAATGRKLSLDD